MALIPTLCALALAPQATPTSTVPFRIAENAIIVDAAVNGRNVALMFDTGFSLGVQVGDNVNIGKPTGSITLQDFVGTFQAPTVKIKTLKLGEKAIDPTGMMDAVMGRGDYSFSYGMHCDGIMGFSVIKDNVTGINYQHSRFEFYPKTVDISKWVPDNKRTFLVKLLPTGLNACQMWVETGAGKKMVLTLDTGNAFYATTHKDVLERVGLWNDTASPKFVKQSMVASGAVDSWSLKMKDLKIFNVPTPTSVWDIIDRPSSSAEGDGTVGFGFLHNFNIIIDYERRRVWLENYSGKTADDEVGEPGIAAMGDGRQGVRIMRITPNSPAEKAGLKEGDSILSVDGEDLDIHTGYRRMRRLLEGPIGSKVKLAVSSGGSVRRVELDRVGMFNESPAS